MPLHLSRVAFGAAAFADLVNRIEANRTGDVVRLTTRYLPKRHAEILEGGSLYWIIKHQLVGRARVLGFEDTPEGRVNIVLEAKVIPVKPMPRRAHQGWRYLEDADAPEDLGGLMAQEDDVLPAALLSDLAELALI